MNLNKKKIKKKNKKGIREDKGRKTKEEGRGTEQDQPALIPY